MRSFAPAHRHVSGERSASATPGLVLNWGWRYDLVVWLFDIVSRGKVREVRRQTLDLAHLQSGEMVLDVGCGTGTLALEASERAGVTGHVVGVDPAPRQIARARAKAAKRGLPVDFQIGVIEHLPFPAESFDVVLSTWMMHHLPDDLKRRGLAEIARVLKPAGRLVVVDATHPERSERRARAPRLGAGELGIQAQPTLMKQAGFSRVETREIRLSRFTRFSRAGVLLGRKGPA
jgi:ubiquinone/menaquinone biosynthesis C-methylase UbiE